MILLWGLPEDTPLARVYERLQQSAVEVAFVDQRAILDTEIDLCPGPTMEGTLRIREQVIDLTKVSAAYLRPYQLDHIPHLRRAGKSSPAFQHAERVEDLLLSWAELTEALVVNRPLAMAANGSKPYQLAWIHSLDFAIPATLITTDPAAVRAFWNRYQTVVYKSVSGVRSIVSRLTDAHLERLENVVWCPTQFQQYIPGTDYRVHIVGSQLFASQITSNGDDYRYAARQGAITTMLPSDLPAEIAGRCRRMATAMGLLVAGIDLRCTPDGEWYCFEVNPSPGFTYFQNQTQQPIDEAVASLLLAGKVA